jgi:hypothetical protein
MSNGGEVFSMDTPDLKGLLSRLKEIEPKLATNLRRELRRSGEDIVKEQRRLVEQLPPGSSGQAGDGTLRSQISRGLRTRVTTGKNHQGIDIKTTGPRENGYNLARMWQKRRFRHPVFGSDAWVEQPGQPYFFEPATNELRDLMRNRIEQAIENALQSAGN